MFGLFGKSPFDVEMDALEKEGKVLGAELMASLGSFNPMHQVDIIRRMVNLINLKIECCKRHGKTEKIPELLAAREKCERMLP